MSRLKRKWRWVHALQRELVLRRVPHGLLGPAYLCPFADERTRLHRTFWWASGDRFPRLPWLVAEAWLWGRWVFWYAIVSCVRTLVRRAPLIEREEGISRWLQAWRILKLALVWCIPPHESYRYGLYRAPRSALDYLYDVEASAYHTWRSKPLCFNRDSARLLQDKSALAELLRCWGIPVVATVAVGQCDSTPPDFSVLLALYGRLFCKTNTGKGGQGAFSVWRTPVGIAGRTFQGADLVDAADVNSAWRKLAECDEVLVQPLLENHAAIAALAFQQETITVRYISEQVVEEAEARAAWNCLSATIEIPAGRTRDGSTWYTLLPLDPKTGTPIPSRRRIIANADAKERVLAIEHDAQNLSEMPHWSALAAYSCLAHEQLPGIRAIAWDWVITPDGPFLLEGNFGWGPAAMQAEGGGLIARRVEEAVRHRRTATGVNVRNVRQPTV